MRRSLLLLPVVAVVALTGCIVAPPPVTSADPEPSPDVTTQPSPDVSTPPSSEQDALETEPVPAPDDDIGPITAGGNEGSPGNPWPAGTDLTGAEWDVALSATNLDAEPAVIAGGGLPAPEGWRWISAELTVTTTAPDQESIDLWASHVTQDGQVYFSTIDASIPGTNPFDDMVVGQEYRFTEYLLVPEATLEQGVMAVTTDGRTVFFTMQ